MHAHMEYSTRDCDGTYTGGNVYEMTTQEKAEEFGPWVFQQRVVATTVNVHGYGTLVVTPLGITWDEPTEEGYRAVEIRWCEDECPQERSWQRDHRAEEAGY